jgi:hypothetical protein
LDVVKLTTPAVLTEALGERTRELYRIADVVFGRWLDIVYSED